MTRRHRKPPKPRHVDGALIVAAPGPHVAEHAVPATTGGLPLAEAARELDVSEGTLRRWIVQGAPVASRGRRGRGCRTLICPNAIRQWRAATGREAVLIEISNAMPELIARAAMESWRQAQGVDKRRLAGVMAGAWFITASAVLDHLHRLHPAIAPDPRALPEPIQLLRKIAGQ